MLSKLISVNEVISKIVRDLGLTDQIPYQDFIEWTGEALQFIGAYPQYHIKKCTVHVHDYCADLPCDFYKPTYNISGLCYRIELGKILTDVKDCDIEIEYLAIPIDKDGFPMCPDDVSYTTACFWYVARMLALRGELPPGLQLGNKTVSSYEYCHQKWVRYCAQARANGYMPGIDQMQKGANQHTKLIPDLDEYYRQFKTLGRREILNRDRR